MLLHKSKDFNTYVELAMQELKLSEDIIVKDYFVTLALKKIYENFNDIVLIGGTSLSKGYEIINRFSEDIDLAAIGTSKKKKQKKTEEILTYLMDTWEWEVINKNTPTSDFKPIFLTYNYNIEELSQNIRVELLSFTDPFPIEKRMITSLISQFLIDKEIKDFQMESFEVITQDPIRTMFEKIVIHKELYKEYKNNIDNSEGIQARARDYYDIHKIWLSSNKGEKVKINIQEVINSRISNRKNRTQITIEELTMTSLSSIFIEFEIEKLLQIDKDKLSIRDLNIKDIMTSLSDIDTFLEEKM